MGPGSLLVGGGGQRLAALGAAVLEHLAAVGRGHPGTETVRAAALHIAGLVRPFSLLWHGRLLQIGGQQGNDHPWPWDLKGRASYAHVASPVKCQVPGAQSRRPADSVQPPGLEHALGGGFGGGRGGGVPGGAGPAGQDQVHQTIYQAMGISPETNYVVEARPFYTTPDGKGKSIEGVFG